MEPSELAVKSLAAGLTCSRWVHCHTYLAPTKRAEIVQALIRSGVCTTGRDTTLAGNVHFASRSSTACSQLTPSRSPRKCLRAQVQLFTEAVYTATVANQSPQHAQHGDNHVARHLKCTRGGRRRGSMQHVT